MKITINHEENDVGWRIQMRAALETAHRLMRYAEWEAAKNPETKMFLLKTLGLLETLLTIDDREDIERFYQLSFATDGETLARAIDQRIEMDRGRETVVYPKEDAQ